jgi:hypothetical protein
MRLLLKNGPVRALVDVDVPDAWRVETLDDRVRLTHPLGMRVELCPTDLPSWPPSDIRRKFTEAYAEGEIDVCHSSGLELDGEPIVYKLAYVTDGARRAPDDEVVALLESVRIVPMDRTRIITGEPDS